MACTPFSLQNNWTWRQQLTLAKFIRIVRLQGKGGHELAAGPNQPSNFVFVFAFVFVFVFVFECEQGSHKLAPGRAHHSRWLSCDRQSNWLSTHSISMIVRLEPKKEIGAHLL